MPTVRLQVMHQKSSDYQFMFKSLAEALYSALADDPFYQTMEQLAAGSGTPKQAMLKYFDYSMVEAYKYGELFIPATHKFGVSVWLKPLSLKQAAQKSEEKKRFLRNHLGERCVRFYNDISSFMSNKTSTITTENYWYLSIIGVLPECQGQGLGGVLIENVLRKTDRLGIPTYLETFTPRNETFYKRHGYQVADSFFEPTVKANYSLMVRMPN